VNPQVEAQILKARLWKVEASSVDAIQPHRSGLRRRRHPLLGTARFFDGKPPVVVFLIGLALVGVVAVLDYLVSLRISLALFYLVPVGVVTWELGRRWGAAMVIAATVAGLFAEVLAYGSGGGLVPYWNALVRGALLGILAMLLATFHESIQQQIRRAETERGVSDQLRELNDMKNTLLHAVSHDLKGPLAAILGSVGTLRRGEQLQLTGDQRDGLYEAIDVSGRKMDRLVNDLLDLDRIDREDLAPEREPIDVGDLARRVMRECEQVGAHPVRVEADQVLIDVDRSMVERIIENLLVNAARHTPVGTPVHIGVRARADAIVLTVEDEGPGIPTELKDSLFDPFRQGAGASGGGVGIGLSLVKKFAELHGGSAKVEDAPGGGARFVIILPGKIQARDPIGKDARLRAV
jgi:two-component system sensor histidine kinase KdpD